LLRDWPDHASTVTDLVWRPCGLELTSSAYGGVRLWSPGGNEPVREFAWKGSVLRLAWSPDGKYLATGDQDSTVHFWIAAIGQDLHMFGYPMKARELAWDVASRFSLLVPTVQCLTDAATSHPARSAWATGVVAALVGKIWYVRLGRRRGGD
jgi:WD40 repeat protein